MYTSYKYLSCTYNSARTSCGCSDIGKDAPCITTSVRKYMKYIQAKYSYTNTAPWYGNEPRLKKAQEIHESNTTAKENTYRLNTAHKLIQASTTFMTRKEECI